MPLYNSHFIYTPEGWLVDHVLETDEDGTIIEVRPQKSTDNPPFYEGILCPGFINCHCHLELSAMKGMIAPQTGMTGFVKAIVEKRHGIDEDVLKRSIQEAMDKAHDFGTVAIGDICNTSLTVETKKDHAIYTHSFVELLGLNSDKADQIIEDGLSTLKLFDGLSASITSHAPYSMSSGLIRKINQQKNELLSIHLLESKEERQLFERKDGPFVDLYQSWGIPFDGFDSANPIKHVIQGMNEDQSVIFIHNTEIQEQELQDLLLTFPNAYFCLCPRSNKYIHDTFPDIKHFLPIQDRICLGTDSLASNYSLNMLDELKAMLEIFPDIDLHILLKWVTTNGAKALRQGINFGIFAAETKPGVNLITNIDTSEGKPSLTSDSDVLKLK